MASAALVAAAAPDVVNGTTARSEEKDQDDPQSHHALARQLVARARNHILAASATSTSTTPARTQQEQECCSAEAALDPVSVWSVLHQQLLTPQLPFAVHRICYELVYAALQREDPNAIHPSWIPPLHPATSSTNNAATETTVSTPRRTTHVEQEMHERGLASYHELYEWSIQHKNEFWMRAAEKVGIQWMQPPQRALEDDELVLARETTTEEETQYYPGARLNIAESCFHGQKDDIAVVYANDSDPSNLQYWTVQDLRTNSHRVAHSICTVWQLPPGTAIALWSKRHCRPR